MILKALNISESDSQLLAANLSTLFKNNNLNVNQVAQALGIPVMTVRRLLSGETTDPRVSTLKLVADHFGVTVDSLLEDNSIVASKKNKPYFVPLLDWDTAKEITTLSDLDLSKWKDWQPVSLGEQNAMSINTFALESRPSMHPRFPQGTIFIIDPDATPRDGDIVLVKIKQNNELTLRELTIDPPEWQLQAVVPGSSVLLYSEQHHEIVGISLLTMFYNRKEHMIK